MKHKVNSGARRSDQGKGDQFRGSLEDYRRGWKEIFGEKLTKKDKEIIETEIQNLRERSTL